MKYHYTKPTEYSSMYGQLYECNHPAYNHCTLYLIGDKGLAVIQQRYDKKSKCTWWSEIDRCLTDALYLHSKFKSVFDKYASKEVEETVVSEDGTEVVEKKTIELADPNTYSPYAKFYDDGCSGWTKDSEANLMFLRMQQDAATKRLKQQGWLLLNDVYDMLGIPRTKDGMVIGWVYDEKHPVGDNFVDFGIYDTNRASNRDFVNGYERTILLDFNVDGNIYDLM